MQHSRQKEKGIVHLAIIIATVIFIAATAFGGWWVWQKNKDEKQQTNNVDNTEKKEPVNTQLPPDEIANWVKVTTQGGKFTMKVPDGWKVTRYPHDFLGAVEVTHIPGTAARIDTSDTEYFGHSLRFRASISELDDAGMGPQWTSPQPGLEESTQDFYIGSLSGKRYKGVFSQDLHQTIYEYIFDLENNMKLDIVYTVFTAEDEKDDVETIEKAIKTINLN